jgi:uncharacterized protein
VRLATATQIIDPIVNVVADVLKGAGTGRRNGDRAFLAWAEGVLTAAAIGPRCVRPSEWMRRVFGRYCVFESAESAQTSMMALGLMHNMIIGKLEREGSDYSPPFLESAEQGEEAALAVLWTEGFLIGMRLHGEALRRLIDSPQGKLCFTAIAAFMTDTDGESVLQRPAEEVAEIRKEALPWLGPSVFEMAEYWTLVAKRPGPVSVAAVPRLGRNDPCPCGSGKKYKKCCIDQT